MSEGTAGELGWRGKISAIPDWPQKGVVFRDVSPLLADHEALSECISEWCGKLGGSDFNKIVAIDSRGFIFGGMLAMKLGKHLVLVRKKGKLPPSTISEAYSLEYGNAELEIKPELLSAGDNVLIVDDVLATGGTAKAAKKLVQKAGAKVAAVTVLIKLKGLYKEDHVDGAKLHSMIEY